MTEAIKMRKLREENEENKDNYKRNATTMVRTKW